MSRRHVNSIPGSSINAVITIVNEGRNQDVSKFVIDMSDYTIKEIHCCELADFLNDVSGRLDSKRIISEEVENGVFNDFAHLLRLNDRKYSYVGSLFPESHYLYSSDSESDNKRSLDIELLTKENLKGQKNIVCNFSNDEALHVAQAAIAITTSESAYPILGTTGASTCINIAVYNSQTKQALLAHIDGNVILESLTPYFDKLSTGSQTLLQVHLRGGERGTIEQTADLIRLINARDDTVIVSASVGKFCGDPKSLAIDSRTGDIFTSFSDYQLRRGMEWLWCKNIPVGPRTQSYDAPQTEFSMASYKMFFSGVVEEKTPCQPKFNFGFR